MATATGIPDLPDRHPGRFYRVETDGLPPPPTLSEELIDQWEHATLLFYGYEWQASAENFLYLSSVIDLQFESAQCLLNAAIIFARLGDYDVASEALEGAAKADDFRALAFYLWGHVEFERGDLQESERYFQAALVELGGKRQYFARLGLDFVLDAPKIQHNLSAFDIQNISLDTIPDLGSAALPADSVFESPQRSPDSGYASPQSPQSPTKPEDPSRASQHDAQDVKRTPKALLAHSKHEPSHTPQTQTLKSLEYSKGEIHWHEPAGTASHPSTAQSTAQPAETSLTAKRSVRSTRSIGGLVRSLSTRHKNADDDKPKSPKSPKSPKQPKSQSGSPRTGFFSRMVPREAKVQDSPVHELAGFIRDLPAQGNPVEAWDGRVSSQHTRDLAAFLRESGPSGEESRMQVDSHHESRDVAHHESMDYDMQSVAHEHDATMYDSAPHAMQQSYVSQDSLRSTVPHPANAFAPSVHSVFTDAASRLADDEASDSGDDDNSDHGRYRDSTPTPPNNRRRMS